MPRELLRRGGGGGGGDIGGLPFPFEVHRGVHLLVSARGCVTWRVYDTYASAADADALARALRDDIPRGALFAMSIEDDGSAEFTPRLLAAVRALAAESGCASGPSQPTFRGAWCMVGQRGSNCYFRARPPLPPELQGGRSVLPAACPEFWVDLSVTGALDGAAPLLTPVAAAVSARVSGGGGEGGGGTGLDDGAAWPPPSPPAFLFDSMLARVARALRSAGVDSARLYEADAASGRRTRALAAAAAQRRIFVTCDARVCVPPRAAQFFVLICCERTARLAQAAAEAVDLAVLWLRQAGGPEAQLRAIAAHYDLSSAPARPRARVQEARRHAAPDAEAASDSSDCSAQDDTSVVSAISALQALPSCV